jgi:hypothetical protein
MCDRSVIARPAANHASRGRRVFPNPPPWRNRGPSLERVRSRPARVSLDLGPGCEPVAERSTRARRSLLMSKGNKVRKKEVKKPKQDKKGAKK